MGCDQPLNGWLSKFVEPSGKRRITFNRNAAFSPRVIKLPCGQCIGCRLEHSRQWAVRCVHESKMHEFNTFLTLTYNPENLPHGGTLVRRDPQLFMKRLRDEFGAGIRFYGCGEYGEQSRRPHYHIILFNFRAPDAKFYKMAAGGQRLYTSDAIAKLWPVGFNVLGDVTFESCAYVARYVTKKITGDNARAHYTVMLSDGELVELLPEFSMMSRRPGIGAGWFEKYGNHAYQFDSVIMNGREVRPPRFYDTRFEVLDSDRLRYLKTKRRSAALKHRSDNTSARRHVKEEVLRLTLNAKRKEL